MLPGGAGGVSALVAAQDAKPPEAKPAGVNHELLRKYFREQYLSLHSGRERDEAPVFVDQFIDRRIEAFLQEIEERITSVRRLQEEIEALRLSEAPGASPRLRRALHELADRLGDLRGALSPLFIELKSKSRYRPELQRGGSPPYFGPEFKFLRDRIDDAESAIRQYLFSAGATVSVDALRGGDMLISLYEAAQMAKYLSREY